MLAGAGGAMVGSPADVILVRMQADGKLPVDQRRNYKNAFNGIFRIIKDEGPLKLWKVFRKDNKVNLQRDVFQMSEELCS